jgi:hypothetical protein
MSKRELNRLLEGVKASETALPSKRVSRRPDGTTNRRGPNVRARAPVPAPNPAPPMAQDAGAQLAPIQTRVDPSSPSELSIQESAASAPGQHQQECASCANAFPPDEFRRLSRCRHDAETCRTCFEKWLMTQINDAVVVRIECSSSECDTVFKYSEIQEHVSDETFQR